MLAAILLALLVATVVMSGVCGGTWLIWRGWRGREVDVNPRCAHCRFNLIGHVVRPPLCPECGSSLIGPGCVQIGIRQRNEARVFVGVVLIAVVVLPVVVIVSTGGPVTVAPPPPAAVITVAPIRPRIAPERDRLRSPVIGTEGRAEEWNPAGGRAPVSRSRLIRSAPVTSPGTASLTGVEREALANPPVRMFGDISAQAYMRRLARAPGTRPVSQSDAGLRLPLTVDRTRGTGGSVNAAATASRHRSGATSRSRQVTSRRSSGQISGTRVRTLRR